MDHYCNPRNGDVPFIVLLVLEGPQDSISVGEMRVAEGEFSGAGENSDNVKAAEFCFSFGGCYSVFARATCSKESGDC